MKGSGEEGEKNEERVQRTQRNKSVTSKWSNEYNIRSMHEKEANL
jgi:hypothetical protein